MPDHHSPAATDAARRLLSAAAVRERAHALLAPGSTDGSRISRSISTGSTPAPTRSSQTIRANYPDPRHPLPCPLAAFLGRRLDRWGAVAARRPGGRCRMARAAFDLAIVCVLLDAGAGPDWRYRKAAPARPSRAPRASRSRASTCSSSGAFSSHPERPVPGRRGGAGGADPAGAGAAASRSAPDNPLVGLEGRAALLNRLGEAVAANPDVFGRADEPAARRPVRPSRGASGGRRCFRPRPSWPRVLRPSRPDLAGAHRARRRRTSATPGGIPLVERRTSDRRARAVPQAVAVARPIR